MVDYRAVRSILETPILDRYKWAKIPHLPADMVFVDLEDSVPVAGKDEARARAGECLADKEFFGDKLILARPNHLSTPWGLDDIKTLVDAGAECIAYPKISSIDDLAQFVDVLDKLGASPDIFAIIETAGSVMWLREIASFPKVVALMSGPADLSVDAGMAMYEPDGALNPAFLVTKTLTVLAGAALGLATTDFAIVPNLRDLDSVRARVEESKRLGFTGMSTFYPPHVDIINEVFSPSAEERATAERLIATYEAALDRGDPAVLSDDGELVLVHDYHKAQRVVRRS
jgi:citrate lyase beta subunit